MTLFIGLAKLQLVGFEKLINAFKQSRDLQALKKCFQGRQQQILTEANRKNKLECVGNKALEQEKVF